jgi:deoxyribose-phosphate aldolase
VGRLCRKAAKPLSRDVLELLMGDTAPKLTTAAVCVYPSMVPTAVKILASMNVDIPVASGIIIYFL